MHRTLSGSAVSFVLVVLVLLACSGCGGEANERVVSTGASDDAAADAPSGHEDPTSGGLVVDVAGAVRRPGVYRMHAGARVHEAIEAAGGARSGAELSALNRAAPLVDGQQVLVGSRASSGFAATATAATPGAAVSINAADVQQLQELPGIGPVTAQKIVDERESGGPFASVDDLDRVPGIGPATIESLREAATT